MSEITSYGWDNKELDVNPIITTLELVFNDITVSVNPIFFASLEGIALLTVLSGIARYSKQNNFQASTIVSFKKPIDIVFHNF